MPSSSAWAAREVGWLVCLTGVEGRDLRAKEGGVMSTGLRRAQDCRSGVKLLRRPRQCEATRLASTRALCNEVSHQVRVGSHSPERMLSASCSSRGSLAMEATARTAWARRAAAGRVTTKEGALQASLAANMVQSGWG
jgi:hypothetical protein